MEFVIILPVLLLLLLIAIDFGRVFATYVDVNNAAREGAAYAQFNPTEGSGITAYATHEKNVQGQGGEGTLSVSATCHDSGGNALDCAATPGGAGTGNTITVTASERFTFLTPFIGNLFGGGINLQSSSTAAVLVLASSGGDTWNCGTLPVPAFTYTTAGLTVTLDAATSNPHTGLCGISGYNWNMGDLPNPYWPAEGMYATYTYASAGTYTITLTATNLAGAATTSQTVTVNTATPGPTATASPTLIPTAPPVPTIPPPQCNTAPSFTYKFTGNGNGNRKDEMQFYGSYTGQPAPATWHWAFGDGHTDQGPLLSTVTRPYTNAGTYTVTLTVTNGSCSKSTSQQVSVP